MQADTGCQCMWNMCKSVVAVLKIVYWQKYQLFCIRRLLGSLLNMTVCVGVEWFCC
jgi:hypothetical protein